MKGRKFWKKSCGSRSRFQCWILHWIIEIPQSHLWNRWALKSPWEHFSKNYIINPNSQHESVSILWIAIYFFSFPFFFTILDYTIKFCILRYYYFYNNKRETLTKVFSIRLLVLVICTLPSRYSSLEALFLSASTSSTHSFSASELRLLYHWTLLVL